MSSLLLFCSPPLVAYCLLSMSELWLNFIDEHGDERRLAVAQNYFVVGRSSDNDLCFPDNRLSRRHVEIACYGDEFYVTDCGSSNGTTLNGAPIADSAPLKNGDVLNLGGGLEIKAEIVSAERNDAAAGASAAPERAGIEADEAAAAGAPDANLPPVAAPAAGGSSGIPVSFFIIAPVLGFLFLALAGGLIFLFSGSGGKQAVQNRRSDDFIYTDNDDDDSPSVNRNAKDVDKTPTPKAESSRVAADSSPSPKAGDSPPPAVTPVSSENDKIERSTLAFMRRIAQNDPNPVLTGKQVETIGAKIKSLKSSPALRDNMQAATKNSSQFESLAQSKNLKPQMLATAGLAKLGTTRGDPLAAAREMTDVLQKLSIHVGTEFADDNLIVVAAFDQGQNNQFLKMRDTMAALTRQFPDTSSRAIRTIWFLREKGKLTETEFEFALRFLAIGAITQNPKDFGVETEALVFN